jgi:rhodanese-related sulfurtransferase
MVNFDAEPMGLYGALAACAVFGIFIATWWWFGMRAYRARRMLETGQAILVDVDEAEVFAKAPVDGAHNIPFERIEDFVWELGSTRRLIVLCSTGAIRGVRAALRFRELGFRVMNLGSTFAERHA